MLNLRTLFVILLISGFCYTASEVRQGFIDLRIDRIAQVEAVINE